MMHQNPQSKSADVTDEMYVESLDLLFIGEVKKVGDMGEEEEEDHSTDYRWPMVVVPRAVSAVHHAD